MDIVTALIFSLTFSGMAVWVRSLYEQLERSKRHISSMREINRRLSLTLEIADKKIKSYELF